MIEIENQIIYATTRSAVSTSPKFLFENSLQYKIYVKLPEDLQLYWVVYGIHELDDNVDILPECTIDNTRPWIDIPASKINRSIGNHIYEIQLIHPNTNETSSIYFAYHMQSNNPDKPYIYMDKEGK